jgi:hypothetical protein
MARCSGGCLGRQRRDGRLARRAHSRHRHLVRTNVWRRAGCSDTRLARVNKSELILSTSWSCSSCCHMERCASSCSLLLRSRHLNPESHRIPPGPLRRSWGGTRGLQGALKVPAAAGGLHSGGGR